MVSKFVHLPILATGLLLCICILATAEYEDVEFTELIDDSGDHPVAYYDFRTISVGEPGDGTVVFRGTVGNIGQLPRHDATVMFFGFTTDAFILGGAFYDLVLNTRNIGEAIEPDSCIKEVSENAIYCAWSYDRIRTGPGQSITNIWGFIDGCATRSGCLPQDTAPGGIATQGWNPASTPHAYTLTGCTVVGGCIEAEAEPDPAIFTKEIEDLEANISQTFENPTSDTYIFNWTTSFEAVNVTYGAAVENGSFELTILDGDGVTVLQQTVTESSESVDLFEGAVPGNWTMTVEYKEFLGSFFLSIREHEVEDHDHVEEVEPLEVDEVEEKKGLPGFGVVGLLAGLGIAAVMRRRE